MARGPPARASLLGHLGSPPRTTIRGRCRLAHHAQVCRAPTRAGRRRRRSRRQQARHARGRGVGAVRRAEGIVDVGVGEGCGERPRERRGSFCVSPRRENAGSRARSSSTGAEVPRSPLRATSPTQSLAEGGAATEVLAPCCCAPPGRRRQLGTCVRRFGPTRGARLTDHASSQQSAVAARVGSEARMRAVVFDSCRRIEGDVQICERTSTRVAAHAAREQLGEIRRWPSLGQSPITSTSGASRASHLAAPDRRRGSSSPIRCRTTRES